MSYSEEQGRKSRVVVETPQSRREYVESQQVRTPDRSGLSATTVGVLVVLVVALVTMVVLLLMNNQPTDTANANIAAQQPAAVPQTTIVAPPQQQQPPVIIQQPAPVTQPAPVIINPPSGGSAPSTIDDTTIQAAIDKKLADDPVFSKLGITATVSSGKVTMVGTVDSASLKTQLERAVKAIKGVTEVDNQIVVVSQ